MCGAEFGARTAERTGGSGAGAALAEQAARLRTTTVSATAMNRGHGYRHGGVDTRVGTLNVAIQTGEGSFFPYLGLEGLVAKFSP